jgi:hypothetical protein
MAAPGNGSRIRPTITPTKIEKKYHAWGAKPEGTGNKARTTAMATGATVFHIGIAAFASGRLLGAATVPLDGAACVGLPRVVLESPILFLGKIDSVLNT